MKKKGKIRRALVSGITASLILTAVSAVPAMASPVTSSADTAVRIGGRNRVETATMIAEKSWLCPAWWGSKTAVLMGSSDANIVDGLVVAPLAYKYKAPILLSVDKDTIAKETMIELRLHHVNTVYIATGTGVISEKAEAELKANHITVKRLGGIDRYETARNISNELGATSEVAVVNGAVGMADAMSIASIAARQQMAIALSCNKDATPTTTNLSGKTIYAIGGTGVLSESLVSKIGATRFGGNTRYETNAKVIEGFKARLNFDKVYFADGADEHLIDSLTGSVLAAQTKSPIVLTDTRLGLSQTTILTPLLTKLSNIFFLGGTVDVKRIHDIVEYLDHLF